MYAAAHIYEEAYEALILDANSLAIDHTIQPLSEAGLSYRLDYKQKTRPHGSHEMCMFFEAERGEFGGFR